MEDIQNLLSNQREMCVAVAPIQTKHDHKHLKHYVGHQVTKILHCSVFNDDYTGFNSINCNKSFDFMMDACMGLPSLLLQYGFKPDQYPSAQNIDYDTWWMKYGNELSLDVCSILYNIWKRVSRGGFWYSIRLSLHPLQKHEWDEIRDHHPLYVF